MNFIIDEFFINGFIFLCPLTVTATSWSGCSICFVQSDVSFKVFSVSFDFAQGRHVASNLRARDFEHFVSSVSTKGAEAAVVKVPQMIMDHILWYLPPLSLDGQVPENSPTASSREIGAPTHANSNTTYLLRILPSSHQYNCPAINAERLIFCSSIKTGSDKRLETCTQMGKKKLPSDCSSHHKWFDRLVPSDRTSYISYFFKEENVFVCLKTFPLFFFPSFCRLLHICICSFFLTC